MVLLLTGGLFGLLVSNPRRPLALYEALGFTEGEEGLDYGQRIQPAGLDRREYLFGILTMLPVVGAQIFDGCGAGSLDRVHRPLPFQIFAMTSLFLHSPHPVSPREIQMRVRLARRVMQPASRE